MNNTPLHAIAGAGQIGPLVAQRLRARGLRVRLIQRRPLAGVPSGVEVVSADLSSEHSAAEALRGAAVVYHCANPRYHRWGTELLPLTRGLVGGATRAGAALVALDNLYMYGGASPMREDTPVAPVSTKGALRAEAAELMLAAGRRGDLRVALGRASDFVGPGATLAAIFGARFWPALLAGKAVDVMGDPDQPHSYSYTPDVADGLVALGTAAGEAHWGRVWHLPALPAAPTRAWVEALAEGAGVRRPVRLRTTPPWLLRALGLFVPEAGEVVEMLYQWRAPFVLDDSAIRAALGLAPTPQAEVVRATVAWARAHFARGTAVAQVA